MSGYDRINVPDRLKFSDLQDDDPQLDEWGVQLKPQQESSLKRACRNLRKKPLIFFIVLGLAALILFIVVIGLLVTSRRPAQASHRKSYPAYQDRDVGLVFQPKPQDNSILIRYSPFKYDTYKQYHNQMDVFLHAYNPLYQQSNKEYDDCKNQTKVEGKTCRFSLDKLGKHECAHLNFYGFKEGMPCIVLQLKVPEGVRPRPVLEGDRDFQEAKAALGDNYSPDSVGVTCTGTTAEDQSQIGHQREPTRFFPARGFPVYLFPNQHLPPLVMVKFGTVADLHDVSITCRAWVGALGAEPVNDASLFSTTFVISKYAQ